MNSRVIVSLMLVSGLLATLVLGGNLMPPPGPVAPTMKTLSEVEPRIAINAMNTPGDATAVYIISQPGSYYLAADVVGTAGKDGIKVTAASGSVSIDLKGFALRGVAGSGNGLNSVVGIDTNLDCLHGMIQAWGGDGMQLNGSGHVNLQDIVISGCGGDGVDCAGVFDIRNSTLLENTGCGVRASSTSPMASSLLLTNIGASGLDGVVVAGPATIRDVTISDSTGTAIKTLATATGVEVGQANVSGAGKAIDDAGTGTVLKWVDFGFWNMSADSALKLGAKAQVHNITLNVLGGTTSGTLVDASAPEVSIDGLVIKATGVTATSALTCGPAFHGSGGPLEIVATDCALSSAIVDMTGDAVAVKAPITIAALGGTTAPTAIRVGGNRCSLADSFFDVFFEVSGVPVGIDLLGSHTSAGGIRITGVPAGGTGVRINSGAVGTELRGLSISGMGRAIDDWGTGAMFARALINLAGASVPSAVVLGQRASVENLTLNATGCPFSAPIVDASASGVHVAGLTLNAAGTTATTALTAGAGFDGFEWGFNLTNTTLSGGIVELNGDGGSLRTVNLRALGTTSAAAAFKVQANGCSADIWSGMQLLGASVPVGIEISGSSNSIVGAVLKGIPSAGTGVRILAGANGNQIDGCRIGGSGAGQITAISVAGNNNVVLGNRINALAGGAAINNTGAGNVVAPIANAGNIATLTNPAANFVH